MTWFIRQARPADLPDLQRLAKKLDSINLPSDRSVILEVIRRSQQSFASPQKGWGYGQYLFVLEESRGQRVIGSSQILDKHGIVNRPYISFKLVRVEKFSRTTGRRFTHTCLKLEWNPEGITEIGGLILDERHRSHPDKLGKLLSYVRFLYMAMHPEKFRAEILAELLPPLDKNGISAFWEHVGKKFTGMDYKDANTKCRTNAEFMFSLFPHTLIYINLLPEKIQKLIGAVHPDTQPVVRMLESIGFRCTDDVCPFDGGPHFRANMNDVTLIKRCRAMKAVAGKTKESTDSKTAAPVLIGHDTGEEFRAYYTKIEPRESEIRIDPKLMKNLGIESGQIVHILPL